MTSDTPIEDSGRGTLSTAADRSNRSQKKSSRGESSKKEMKKNEEKWSRVRGYTMPVIVSFILQLGFLGYTAYEMLKVTGNGLLYLVGFIVVTLASLFFTIEVIIIGSKLWIVLSAVVAALASAGSCILLVVKIHDDVEQEQHSKIIQQLAAIVIVILVFHLLVLYHYFLSKFGKKTGQNKKTDILFQKTSL